MIYNGMHFLEGFHIEHFDPEKLIAETVATLVKHPLGPGITEYIKIGDHEIPIQTSPMVPPGQMLVFYRGKLIQRYINLGVD